MASIVEKPFRIVVGIDTTDDSSYVLERALDTAARHERPELHFAHVVDARGGLLRHETETTDALEEVDGELRKIIGAALEDFGHPLDQLGTWRVHVHVRAGKAANELIELAKDARADLLIVGRHRTRPRIHLGSVPKRLLEKATCTVEVVQPADYGPTESDDDACPACVAIRASTEGEVWFCSEHRGSHLWLSATWRDGWLDSPRGGGLR